MIVLSYALLSTEALCAERQDKGRHWPGQIRAFGGKVSGAIKDTDTRLYCPSRLPWDALTKEQCSKANKLLAVPSTTIMK